MTGEQQSTSKKRTCPSNEHERDFQAKVLRYLEENYGSGHWLKVCASSFQKTGEPDIVGWYNGKAYAFELKTHKGRPTALQTYKINLIKANGGIAMIIQDLSQIKEAIENAQCE